jgi:TrmH family RNA methyltransferase
VAALTQRSARVVFARKLTRRAGRDRAGAFLAEGVQAVREALHAHADGAARVREVFVTDDAAVRHADLMEYAGDWGIAVWNVTDHAASTLSETVTPQGLLAVCDLHETTLSEALVGRPSLVAVLVGVADPGNAGTVVRVADAAGADAVLFAGNTVDPYNGKAVRASTGSLFHLPIARDRDPLAVLEACRAVGLRLLGADGHAPVDLDAAESRGALVGPVAWVFGDEAHGLPPAALSALDAAVRVPLYGRAESLNLATAAAVCLYSSARAQRRGCATLDE